MTTSRFELLFALATWASILVDGYFAQVPVPIWQGDEPDETCRVSVFEPCKLSKMQRDKVYLVYPGGASRCISEDQPEYSFIVIPGDADKLLVYFEGGGICFDGKSRTVRLCPDKVGDTKVDGQSVGHGLLRRDSERNPFRNYTVVVAKYCSGDLYLGDLKKPYGEVRGIPNARATIEWARKQADPWDKLVLSGQSAGGIGMHIWSRTLLRTLRHNHAAVIIDSFIVGIFPVAVQRMLSDHFDFCASHLLSPADEADCKSGDFMVQQALVTAMDEFPNVAFALVNSKTDATQLWMYNVVTTTLLEGIHWISPDDLYRRFLTQLEYFNTRPNFVSYLINSDQHGYFTSDVTGTAQTSGLTGDRRPGEIALHLWLENFPITDGRPVKSQCFGRSYYPEQWLKIGPTSDYCDEYQSRKVYGQAGIDKATVHSLMDQDYSHLPRRPFNDSKRHWHQYVNHIHEQQSPVGNILARSENVLQTGLPRGRTASRMFGDHALAIVVVASGILCCSLSLFYFGRSSFLRVHGSESCGTAPARDASFCEVSSRLYDGESEECE